MQISDDIFLGPAVGPNPPGDGNPSPMAMGVGPMGRVYLFDVVPATMLANGIATTQAPAAGADMVLTPGAGTTSRLSALTGRPEIVLDTPRCVTLTASGANTATYRVSGYDQYGQWMTQDLAAPSSSTVATLKAFKVVSRITNLNAAAGAGLTAGFNDTLGLPIRVTDIGQILSVKYGGLLPQDAGTPVVAVQTSPATGLTGDVRGTYTLSLASNGARRLFMLLGVPGIACGPNATRVGAFGVTQA